LLGYFAAVPVHLARDPELSFLIRCIPFIGIILSFLVFILPSILIKMRIIENYCKQPYKFIFLIFLITFSGIFSTLPFGHVSELYLMGPNAGAAILVTIGFINLWFSFKKIKMKNSIKKASLNAPHLFLIIVVFFIFTIGSYGLISRALHFQVTWQNSSLLHQIVNHYHKKLLHSNKTAKIYLLKNCTDGKTHSRYIMPPVQALNTFETETAFNHTFPNHRIEFFETKKIQGASENALIIDCSELLQRKNW
jgi:hypothetical protein